MLTDVEDQTDPFVGPAHSHPLRSGAADRVAVWSPALGAAWLDEALGALFELVSRGRERSGVMSAPGPGAALFPVRVSGEWPCEFRGRELMLMKS